MLTFTPAADAFGVATATVTARDDGGTANGGDDTTSATFTIRLDPVNDAPSFVRGGNVTVLANAGRNQLPWAGAVSAGPPNESGQTVSFATTAADPSLFAPGGQPVLASDGTLSFTPALAASGATTVTVTAHDDGGTADGGVDSTAATSFTLTVIGGEPGAIVHERRQRHVDRGRRRRRRCSGRPRSRQDRTSRRRR